jgi:hypothetical protein
MAGAAGGAPGYQQHLAFSCRSEKSEPTIYVHEDFDHHKVLPPSLWPYQEDAQYLLHLVDQHGLLRHGAAARKDRAVNLKYDYLAEIVEGRQLRTIRDRLEENGWLNATTGMLRAKKPSLTASGQRLPGGNFGWNL